MLVLEILKSNQSQAQKVKRLKTLIQQDDVFSFDFADLWLDDIKTIAQALQNNTHLKKLEFHLNIGMPTLPLAHALTNNQTITDLSFIRSGGHPYDGLAELTAALKQNSTLKKLCLKTHIRQGELKALTELLKDHPEIEDLTIEFYDTVKDEDIAPVIAAISRETKLKKLEISNVGDLSAQSLANIFNENSQLTTLSLPYSPTLGDIGMQALMSSLEKIPTVTDLTLGNDPGIFRLHTESSEALAKLLRANRVKILDLNKGRIFSEALPNLCKGIEENHSLESLRFSGFLRQGDHEISKQKFTTLTKSLSKNHHLTEIDLGYNANNNEGINALTQALIANQHLKALSFQANLNDETAENFRLALERHSSLAQLVLTSGDCTQKGIDELAQALKGTTVLKTLTLELRENSSFELPPPNTNLYTDSIFEALGHNTSLNTLEIKGGKVNIKSLTQALSQNTTLTSLKISCKLSAQEGIQLAKALMHHKTLTHLDLSSNNLGSEGAKAFAELLKTNQTIEHLNISSNDTQDETLEAFASSLKHNKTLTHLSLDIRGPKSQPLKKLVDSLKHNTTMLSLVMDNKMSSGGSDTYYPFAMQRQRLALFLERNNEHKLILTNQKINQALPLPNVLVNIVTDYLGVTRDSKKSGLKNTTLLSKIATLWAAITKIFNKAYLKVKNFIQNIFYKKSSPTDSASSQERAQDKTQPPPSALDQTSQGTIADKAGKVTQVDDSALVSKDTQSSAPTLKRATKLKS